MRPRLAALAFAGLAASVATFLFATTVVAGGCNGLARTACEADETCRWIEARERADGVKTEAQCRALPPSAETVSERLERAKALSRGGNGGPAASPAAREAALEKRKAARERAMEARRKADPEGRRPRSPGAAARPDDD